MAPSMDYDFQVQKQMESESSPILNDFSQLFYIPSVSSFRIGSSPAIVTPRYCGTARMAFSHVEG